MTAVIEEVDRLSALGCVAGCRLDLVQPHDRDALLALFADCSPTTIHQRFFTRMTEFPRSYLESVLARPAEVHDAVVARWAGADNRVVGLASLAVSTQDAGAVAELGVLITDAWQRRGIGTAMVNVLLDRARDRGVEWVSACVLPGRSELLAVLARRLPYIRSVASPDGLASVYKLASTASGQRMGSRP